MWSPPPAAVVYRTPPKKILLKILLLKITSICTYYNNITNILAFSVPKILAFLVY